MSKDPAVLFYTGDFLNGCAGLTMEERGQYITILCLQHQLGHLSEKTIRLSVGSVSVDVLNKLSIDADGNYFQNRMEEEIEKRSQFINSRTLNGSKGGRPKKANGKPYDKPLGQPKQNRIINENINENIIQNDYKIQIEEFENFRKNYPGTKRGYEIEFENFKKKNKDWEKILPLLSDALNYQISFRIEKAKTGGFVPEWKNLSTWINQRCWEEEMQINKLTDETRRKQQGVTDFELATIVAKHFAND